MLSIVPQRLIKLSLYHEILLLQKFNFTSWGRFWNKKNSLQPQKKMRPFFRFWLCLIAVVYPDPKFWIFSIQSDIIKTQWHKVNYFDFCFVSKSLHISNSRPKPASVQTYFVFGIQPLFSFILLWKYNFENQSVWRIDACLITFTNKIFPHFLYQC